VTDYEFRRETRGVLPAVRVIREGKRYMDRMACLLHIYYGLINLLYIFYWFLGDCVNTVRVFIYSVVMSLVNPIGDPFVSKRFSRLLFHVL